MCRSTTVFEVHLPQSDIFRLKGAPSTYSSRWIATSSDLHCITNTFYKVWGQCWEVSVSPLQSNYLRCRLFLGRDRGDVLQHPRTRIRHKNTLHVQAVTLKIVDGIMAASSASGSKCESLCSRRSMPSVRLRDCRYQQVYSQNWSQCHYHTPTGIVLFYLRASEGKVRIDRYHGEKLVKIYNCLLDSNRQITALCYIVLGIIVRCE